MSLRKSVDDGRKDGGCKCLLTSDPHLSDRRIGQEFDVPYALPEFVERRVATCEQRAAVFRGFDAARAAVEKAHTERVFEFSDHLGNCRLAHTERLSCLGHAASLHGREKDMQVPQLEPPPDTNFPVDFLGHNHLVMGIEEIRQFSF
jgi:hypothetical protein